MQELTAHDLRQLISELIAPSIELHRASRMYDDLDESRPSGRPTDEEVDDFIVSNPLFEAELIEQLTDPGLLGFGWKNARATASWLEQFREQVTSWVENNSWLGADLPWLSTTAAPATDKHELWIPGLHAAPLWVSGSPGCLLLAAELLHDGKLLSELGWRDFEELVGVLLESEGWRVTVTRPAKDGGFDVVATRADNVLGIVKSVWQAKKFGPSNKVKLREVRELSAVREEQRASKALIVTTSRLTRDAIEWVKRDVYRIGYKEHSDIERWVRRQFV